MTLEFRTFNDGDVREAIRPAHGEEVERHVATLTSDGNVVWYAEWCSLDELVAIAEEFGREWRAKGGG